MKFLKIIAFCLSLGTGLLNPTPASAKVLPRNMAPNSRAEIVLKRFKKPSEFVSLNQLCRLKTTTENPDDCYLLLNFMASDCSACIREIPRLVNFFARETYNNVTPILISTDELSKFNDLKKFLAQFNSPFEVLLDPNGLASDSFGVYGIPRIFLIDKNQRVLGQIEGAVPDLEDRLAEMLKATLTAAAVKPVKKLLKN